MTADSRFAPAHYIEVEAKPGATWWPAGTKSTTPFLSSGYLPSVSSAETALGRDSFALISAMAWRDRAGRRGAHGQPARPPRWARWPAWAVAVPVLFAIVWNLYQALSALRPNLQLLARGATPRTTR